MKKLYEDYIFLVRTVLEGGRADDFSGDFEKLLKLAREHNMTNILWYALRKNRNVPTNIVTELQGSHNMLMFKCANQKMTRGELENLFSSAGIKHIFLKGADVAQLYLSEDMREMADIDVYADLDSHEKIKEVLTQAGYSFEGHKGHHDVFHRDPFISVEVHESVLDHQRETGLIHTLRRRGSSPTETDLNIISTRATIIFFLWVICSVISIRAESASDSLPIWRSI